MTNTLKLGLPAGSLQEATGGTMLAGAELIKQAGGTVAACAFLVELSFLGGRDKLAGYEVFSLIRY